jgi:hypothetical protein
MPSNPISVLNLHLEDRVGFSTLPDRRKGDVPKMRVSNDDGFDDDGGDGNRDDPVVCTIAIHASVR